MRDEQLREVTCLAHTVPGVTVRLHCTSGAELLVSSTCLGADLDPCGLRATVLRGDTPRLAASVASVEFVAGLVPIGAGLYQRRDHRADQRRDQRGLGSDERWFVTSLSPATIIEVLAEPAGSHERDGIYTFVKPDTELGLQAVCVRAIPGTPAAALDEAAVWALGRLAVAELLARLDHPSSRPTDDREPADAADRDGDSQHRREPSRRSHPHTSTQHNKDHP